LEEEELLELAELAELDELEVEVEPESDVVGLDDDEVSAFLPSDFVSEDEEDDFSPASLVSRARFFVP
jgi:hypothetical protein